MGVGECLSVDTSQVAGRARRHALKRDGAFTLAAPRKDPRSGILDETKADAKIAPKDGNGPVAKYMLQHQFPSYFVQSRNSGCQTLRFTRNHTPDRLQRPHPKTHIVQCTKFTSSDNSTLPLPSLSAILNLCGALGAWRCGAERAPRTLRDGRDGGGKALQTRPVSAFRIEPQILPFSAKDWVSTS